LLNGIGSLASNLAEDKKMAGNYTSESIIWELQKGNKGNHHGRGNADEGLREIDVDLSRHHLNFNATWHKVRSKASSRSGGRYEYPALQLVDQTDTAHPDYSTFDVKGIKAVYKDGVIT
jgi:hypothetical protein